MVGRWRGGLCVVAALATAAPSIGALAEPAAAEPRIEVTPARLDFTPPHPREQRITVANRGGAALRIQGVLIGTGARDFRLGANGCTGAALRRGQRCMVTVTFAPERRRRGRTHYARLFVMTDAAEGTESIVLTARAAPPRRRAPPARPSRARTQSRRRR